MKTLEQIKKEYNDHSSVIKQRQLMIEALKEESVKICPYKVGDKVLVEYGGQHIVFIHRIQWGMRGYEYFYTKPKKDGTMSATGTGISTWVQPLKKIE